MDEKKRFNIFCTIFLIFSGILLFLGWKLFWFLTDDAYIVFRYVNNSILGFGYVWNPPPFLPVEGYTCFLWVFLLDVVWRLTSISPVQSANTLSLLFSFLTIFLSMKIIVQMRSVRDNMRYRCILICFLSLFLLSNRTFLAWSSSGLETAMFSFFILLWFYCCHYIEQTKTLWSFSTSFSAALIALTRPDGILFFASTIFILVVIYFRKRKLIKRRWGLATFPLVLVPIHFIWRYNTYGEWLPNSYYAKYINPWIKSGTFYITSFLLEYAYWFIGLILMWVFIRQIRSKSHLSKQINRTRIKSWIIQFIESRYFVVSVLVVTLSIQILYYTFYIGGDHFEYRIYNHLLPFIFLSMVWTLAKLRLKKSTSIILLSTLIVLSLPVQWTHWAMTKDRNKREETHILWVPIAPKWPKPFYWYAYAFDRLQYWLIVHHVCMRHQEHKVFHQYLVSLYPTRKEGKKITGKNYPVYPQYPVGVPAWIFPHVNILDKWGLNDYIIARGKIRDPNFRRMAHDRRVPKGYVGCFKPNVIVKNKKIIVKKRKEPLTKENIIQTEKMWRQKIKRKNE